MGFIDDLEKKEKQKKKNNKIVEWIESAVNAILGISMAAVALTSSSAIIALICTLIAMDYFIAAVTQKPSITEQAIDGLKAKALKYIKTTLKDKYHMSSNR